MKDNINFVNDICLKKRKGWKSFKGIVYQLKLINNRYKKTGFSGQVIVTLPLK